MSSLPFKSGRRRVAYVVLALGLAVLIGAAAFIAVEHWLRTTDEMVVAGLGYGTEPLLESYFLYDLGVADIDGDRRYDIFTTNHGATQALRLNDGGGFGANAMTALGFAYTAAFPGLRATPSLPEPAGDGLRIDHWRSAIVLRSTGEGRIGGRLALDWPATVATRGQMTARREDGAGWGLPAATDVRFEATGDGLLVLEAQPAPSDGVAIEVELDGDVPLERVAVGSMDVAPEAHAFRLTPGDRHGMAWADANGDGVIDVFISNGGMRGRAETDDSVRDALYVGRAGQAFDDRIARFGIEKAGCPGRRAAWVDIDGDGRLDLYQVCGRGGAGAERAAVANRLYVQLESGGFEEAAADWGLAIDAFGNFRFLDVDDDGRIDLFWAGKDRYTLFMNEGSRFEPIDLGPTPPGPGSRLRQVSVGDVTGNGLLDIFVASRDGNALFFNEGGTLRSVEPASLGLPERAHSASLVDTTNSGRLDLAALPGGIFRQGEDGRFTATGALAAAWPLFMNDARAAWVDVDGDGALDSIIAAKPCWHGRLCAVEEHGLALARRLLQQGLGLVPPEWLYEPLRWPVSLHRADAVSGHWLAIDVVGAAGNRQSIGARVRLIGSDRSAVAEVGQLEAAHQGQGNYRLHLGLGDAPDVARIEVRWPDGATAVLEQPGIDRLVTIRHPAAGG